MQIQGALHVDIPTFMLSNCKINFFTLEKLFKGNLFVDNLLYLSFR